MGFSLAFSGNFSKTLPDFRQKGKNINNTYIKNAVQF